MHRVDLLVVYGAVAFEISNQPGLIGWFIVFKSILLSPAHSILKDVFGYERFRGPQEAIVAHVVSGGDALVLMPTGGGKSLCYQVPAIVRQQQGRGVAIVVSPLIALMHDQVGALHEAGVDAAFLNSSLGYEESQDVELRLQTGDITLLYDAPERLNTPRFLGLLDSLSQGGHLSLFAIDEAPCLRQRGHDSRPEYRAPTVLHEPYAGVPLLSPTGKRILVDVFGTDGKRTYDGFSCPVKVGSWQHLALTYGPGQGVIVYLDGQPVYTNPADLGGPVPMAGPLRLGLDSDPMLPRHFSGLLGGFRIWNKVLTQKEIAQIMQDERPALTGVFRGSNDLSPKLPPAAAIPVGSSKQLLFDDRFIEASKGTALRMNPPQKVGPVLIPENPWEDKSLGFCASVLEHKGIFKLFYETWSTKGTFVCLATSENGVTWERPRLGIIEFDGGLPRVEAEARAAKEVDLLRDLARSSHG